jgi:hypothetical protein
VVKGRGGKTTKKNNKGTKRITKTTRIRTTYYEDTYMLRSKKTNDVGEDDPRTHPN